MERKIVARPCKENNTWEIKDQNGKVCKKHYQTKHECVDAASKLANECGCELCVCDKNTDNE